MTAKVTIQPSATEFRVERGETVLEAALRSGVALNYNCGNGTCGDCKARVLSGHLAEELPHDYVLKEVERSLGTVLLCCAKTDEDLVVEAAEAGTPADIPPERITTTVYRLQQPADDVMLLELRTPRSNTLRFLAGQYARIEVDGVAAHSAAIASCPCNGMYLQFHLRRRPGDAFSDYVFTELKARQKVDIVGPFGDFVLDEQSTRPIVFLAFETGFAPLKSLIEHAIALELAQPMRLYWVAPGAHAHYLMNYCRSWQDALDDFTFVPVDAESGAARAARRADNDRAGLTEPQQALLDAAFELLDREPDLSGFDLYCSGPKLIVERFQAPLLEHGLPPGRLFLDYIEKS
jgi:CDP-4-dehydro-6-deoxyglucose reductase